MKRKRGKGGERGEGDGMKRKQGEGERGDGEGVKRKRGEEERVGKEMR